MSTHTIEMTYDQIDHIIVSQLKQTRQSLLLDIEKISAGHNVNIFFYDEPEKDIAEIQRHIEALTLVLSWYEVPEDVG